jgi:hypothetical protein
VSEKISNYYELQPTQYGVVVFLCVEQAFSEAGVMEQTLKIRLAKKIDVPDDFIEITCIGVRGMKIIQPTLSLISIWHLKIQETITGYQVDDKDEEGVISLQCRDFVCRLGSD